jgi:hypothetical protein
VKSALLAGDGDGEGDGDGDVDGVNVADPVTEGEGDADAAGAGEGDVEAVPVALAPWDAAAGLMEAVGVDVDAAPGVYKMSVDVMGLG